MTTGFPVAILAMTAPARKKPSNYPEPFASRMAGREKRPLGERFGLSNFGVNLEGQAVLRTDEGETLLGAGMCAGFRHGDGNAHQLLNRSGSDVLYLEIGDRSPGGTATYPDDDIEARLDAGGKWVFTRKDGTPY